MKKELYFTFTLNQAKLKIYYQNKNIAQAYNDIYRFMLQRGWESKKDSDYVRNNDSSKLDLIKFSHDFLEKIPWFKNSVNHTEISVRSEKINFAEVIRNYKTRKHPNSRMVLNKPKKP